MAGPAIGSLPGDALDPSQPALVTTAPSFGQAFGASWDAIGRTRGLDAQWRNQKDFLQDHLDAYQQKTGERLDNPLTVFGGQDLVDKYKDKFSKAGMQFPSDVEITQGGIDKARTAARSDWMNSQAPGFAGWAGRQTAGLAASSIDPINAASIALAPEGGLLLRAAGLGASFAAGTAAENAITFNYQRQVNPSLTAGQSFIQEPLEAGASVAALDVSGRMLGAWWRGAKGTPAAAQAPLAAQDAGRVAEKSADLAAQLPFKGADAAAAHAEAVKATEAAIIADKPPELPLAAQAQADARRGTVFYPGGKVDVRYELAEARDLVTSHDADGRVNPAYPAELQPRDRSSVASLEQINEMATRFEPERMSPNPEANSGPPIIGPDNVVESGNGRTAAIRTMYDRVPERAAAYRNWLSEQGYDTTGFSNPVLVARRLDEEQRYRLVEEQHPIDSGEQHFQIEENGREIAHASVLYDPATKDVRVGWISKETGTLDGRSLLDALKQRFPDAKTVSGTRVSGARQAIAGRPLLSIPETRLRLPEILPQFDRAQFAQSLTGSGLRLNATEQALSDARYLSPKAMEAAQEGAVDSAANRDFVRSVLAGMPQAEHGAMVTKGGGLSAVGKRRLEAALTARAYGAPDVVERLYEHPDPNIKTIGYALRESAVPWARMRDAAASGEIAAGHDVTDALMSATRDVMRARDEGRPLWEIMNQGDMFRSDLSQLVARMLFKDQELRRLASQKDIVANLSDYAGEAVKNTAGARLFGEAAKPEEILRATQAKRGAAEPHTADLIDIATKREAREAPMLKEADAAKADLERMRDQGQNLVFAANDKGEVEASVIDRPMAELEGMESMAKEVSACAGGPAIEAAE